MENKPNKDKQFYYHHEFFHSDLSITRSFIERNYSIDMHQQEFYEMNIITKGEGIHYVEENAIKTKVGDVFVIPPYLTHGYVGGKNFDVHHILLSNKFMHKHITDLQQLPNFHMLFNAEPLMRATSQNLLHLSLNTIETNEVFNILNIFDKLDDKQDNISSLIKSNLCMILITKLCDIYSKKLKIENNIENNSDASFMKSISHIHEHFNNKITIDDLCKIAHCSRSSYIRKFKEICKMPPSTYINKKRIEASLNMLINTHYSINEIAYKTGFYDGAHFIKIFEAEIGISPTNYRNKNSI